MPLNQTNFYNKDYIGLKTLNDAGKVHWETFYGDHLQLKSDDIKTKLV